MEISQKMRLMVKAITSGQMESNILETGFRITCKEKVLLLGLTERLT